jgi:hypothetical protein
MINNSFLKFTSISLVGVIIHLILSYCFLGNLFLDDVLIMHVFLFLLTITTKWLQKKLTKKKNISPMILLAINIGRMLICVLFLLPIIIGYEDTDKWLIYHFFFAYFFYLFLDLLSAKKLTL